MPKTTTIKRGRDAESGQFVPIEYANKHPKTTVVETIKIKKKWLHPVDNKRKLLQNMFPLVFFVRKNYVGNINYIMYLIRDVLMVSEECARKATDEGPSKDHRRVTGW